LNISYQELTRPYNFKSPFKGEEFALLLYIADRKIPNDERNDLSGQIVDQSCRYAVCAGIECGLWHDCIDESFVMKSIIEEKEEDFIMTTWHDKESIEDIVHFFVYCTEIGNSTPKNFCVAILGHQKGLMEKIKTEIEKLTQQAE